MINSDIAIRNAKPRTKPYKLYDQKGLFLLITPSGGKLWRMRYTNEGKEKLLTLREYPGLTLAEARRERDRILEDLARGIDPCQQKQAQKVADSGADSFETIAREWFLKQKPSWVPKHADRIIRRLERDIFPWIGARPIAELKAPELLQVLRKIEERGAVETAHRAMQNCGQVFRYAIATGRAERDISADLKGAIAPTKSQHFAAITNPEQLGQFLRIIDGYEGTFTVKAALQLAPLVFVRPGELRQAEWADIDLDKAEWRFIATKTQTSHIVPLSRQAVAILRHLYPLTGHGRYVFASYRTPDGSRPISDNALLAALRRLGIEKHEMSVHGFRAIARTLLDEVLGFRPELIEHQLAHTVKDPLGRAYNRTKHLEERKRMMQAWADYLGQVALMQ
ncbi:MAG: integrase arm-type DNA-binding domain-containing protein [Acidobacteria bacterium]|nr:integrase arm-type DNA-binding domain-containing protein [Acidobacteriota bacterium]MCB9236259.1 integrase arm-type DNA-binding domain-containing protein [Bacteroidia bacterium]